MLFHVKRVLVEYKPFIMQMWAYRNACDVANVNIITLFDVQIFLGFHFLIPLLELLNGLIKMAKA
jgi:hypothetical protein